MHEQRAEATVAGVRRYFRGGGRPRVPKSSGPAEFDAQNFRVARLPGCHGDQHQMLGFQGFSHDSGAGLQTHCVARLPLRPGRQVATAIQANCPLASLPARVT